MQNNELLFGHSRFGPLAVSWETASNSYKLFSGLPRATLHIFQTKVSTLKEFLTFSFKKTYSTTTRDVLGHLEGCAT